MSRSGYDDYYDYDYDAVALWTGALIRAFNGRRGQAFLKELRDALDALPTKRLIADDLVRDGEVCAIGAIGVARGVDMSKLDPEDIYYDFHLSKTFDISRSMVAEIVYNNDETEKDETPENRYTRMREWIASCIVE